MMYCVSHVIGNLLNWGVNFEMTNVEVDLRFGFTYVPMPRPKFIMEGEIYL